MRLVLCSGSPRRREMLERLGLSFDVEVPRVEEARRPGERIVEYPERPGRFLSVGNQPEPKLIASSVSQIAASSSREPPWSWSWSRSRTGARLPA